MVSPVQIQIVARAQRAAAEVPVQLRQVKRGAYPDPCLEAQLDQPMDLRNQCARRGLDTRPTNRGADLVHQCHKNQDHHIAENRHPHKVGNQYHHTAKNRPRLVLNPTPPEIDPEVKVGVLGVLVVVPDRGQGLDQAQDLGRDHAALGQDRKVLNPDPKPQNLGHRARNHIRGVQSLDHKVQNHSLIVPSRDPKHRNPDLRHQNPGLRLQNRVVGALIVANRGLEVEVLRLRVLVRRLLKPGRMSMTAVPIHLIS